MGAPGGYQCVQRVVLTKQEGLDRSDIMRKQGRIEGNMAGGPTLH
jgi:hypothetical protein